jgi:predicted Zn-ribbon and HTH transcriptional regulator
MFRKDLIPMLLDRELTVNEISRIAEQNGKTTTEDLQHLLKSLRHTEYQAVIAPAACRKCGFVFGTDKLRKPSKCPKCNGTWISEPRIRIEGKSE